MTRVRNPYECRTIRAFVIVEKVNERGNEIHCRAKNVPTIKKVFEADDTFPLLTKAPTTHDTV